MANDKTIAPKEQTIDVMVAKRKSIDVDGKVYGPGSKLTLPIGEARALHDLGFIVEPDDDDDAGADAGNDGGLSVQTGESAPA